MNSMGAVRVKFTSYVNGRSDAPINEEDRLIYRPMDMTALLNRIDARLEALRLTAADASVRAGGHKDVIRNFRRSLERGSDTGLSIPNLVELAAVLKTSVEWLVTEIGRPDARPTNIREPVVDVPLISWVSAGALIQPEHVVDVEAARLLPMSDLDEGGTWIALRVNGDSMDRISPPDSIIVVNLRDRRLVSNGCYVFADHQGAATYKRYRPPTDTRPAMIAPVSTNSEHEPIVLESGREPIVVGRVRRTLLDL